MRGYPSKHAVPQNTAPIIGCKWKRSPPNVEKGKKGTGCQPNTYGGGPNTSSETQPGLEKGAKARSPSEKVGNKKTVPATRKRRLLQDTSVVSHSYWGGGSSVPLSKELK